MLRQLLRRGQLTIPMVMLKKFSLKEKDYVEVTSLDEGILIKPVTINDYSHKELEQFRKKLDQLPRGNKRTFGSISESKAHLDSLKEK